MTIFHDEVEIEDFEYDEDDEMYYYPCPCGDRFQISKEELMAGEEVATCPSCSLVVKVIYDLALNHGNLIKEFRVTSASTNLAMDDFGEACIRLLTFLRPRSKQDKFKAETEEIHKDDGEKQTVKV